MPDTEPVKTEFLVDDRQAKTKFDEYERRLRGMEKTGDRAKRSSSAFMSAAVGGAAGFIAGSFANNPATNAISDLLISVIAAGLLPLMQSLLPILKEVGPIITGAAEALSGVVKLLVDKFGADVLAEVGIGAAIGARIAGAPGAAVGAVPGLARATVEKEIAHGPGALSTGEEPGVNFGFEGLFAFLQRQLIGGPGRGGWQSGVFDKTTLWGPDIVG